MVNFVFYDSSCRYFLQ